MPATGQGMPSTGLYFIAASQERISSMHRCIHIIDPDFPTSTLDLYFKVLAKAEANEEYRFPNLCAFAYLCCSCSRSWHLKESCVGLKGWWKGVCGLELRLRGRGGHVRRREGNLSGVATEVCSNQVWSHYYNFYFAYFQNQWKTWSMRRHVLICLGMGHCFVMLKK